MTMRVFQAVVDAGGFAAAARLLNMAPATVTRFVADLEQDLGARLLQRTTRRVSLTEAGSAYLARLRPILLELDEARAMAQEHTQGMSGTLRVYQPGAGDAFAGSAGGAVSHALPGGAAGDSCQPR